MLEFYDFVIFALFAQYFGQAFFPTSDPIANLINTYAVFAVGYLGRPLGSAIFGHLGDRYGRKYAFSFSAFIMAISTFLIGCLPTYQQIGLTASVLLILLRIMQGISYGGETGGVTVFIFEHMVYKKRGLAIGLVFTAMAFGNVLGSLIGFILTHLLDETSLLHWGWRIPFWIGFILSIVAYFIRRNTLETPDFIALQPAQKSRLPIATLFRSHLPQVFTSISLTAIPGTAFALLMYLPNYLTMISSLSLNRTFSSNLISFLIVTLFTGVFGYLSDFFSRKTLTMAGSCLTILLSYSLFQLILSSHQLLLFNCCLALLAAILNGCYCCAIAEQFETRIRYTGVAISLNVGITLFSGMTPLASLLLFKYTHYLSAPVFFLIACSIINLIGGLLMKDSRKKSTFTLAIDTLSKN